MINELMGIPSTATIAENVTRKGDAVPLLRLRAGLRIEMLSAGRTRWTASDGRSTRVCKATAIIHDGEEFLVVVAGLFEVTIEGKRA